MHSTTLVRWQGDCILVLAVVVHTKAVLSWLLGSVWIKWVSVDSFIGNGCFQVGKAMTGILEASIRGMVRGIVT